MKNLDTVIGRRADTSVQVNGVYVPVNSLPDRLQSFVAPALFFSPEFEIYNLSISGSLTKIELQKRQFAVITRHQIGKAGFAYEFQQFGLMDGTGKFLSSHQAVYSKSRESENTLDCLFFEFSDCVSSGQLDTEQWFPADKHFLPTPDVDIVLALGYPGHENIIDYETMTYIDSPYAVWGTPTGPQMRDRLAFSVDGALDYDPFGMSGGPVFGIKLETRGPQLFFLGVVTNASKSAFNFLPTVMMKGFLKELGLSEVWKGAI